MGYLSVTVLTILADGEIQIHDHYESGFELIRAPVSEFACLPNDTLRCHHVGGKIDDSL